MLINMILKGREKAMIGMNEVRKYGYFVVGSLFSLGLLIATQISQTNKAYADDDHESGDPIAHRSGSAPLRGLEKGRTWIQYGKHDRLWHALRQLDLTADQKTAIHEINSTLMQDMIEKRAVTRIAKIELRARLRKDNVDTDAVGAQVKKIEGLKTDMMLNVIKAREEIKSKLTPDQRKKLTELIQKPHQNHHHVKQAG